MRVMAGLMLTAALCACSRQPEQASLDTLDNQLGNTAAEPNTRDPALAGALRDQIMVDPQLSQQSNHGAVRPPPQPMSGEVPPDATHAPPAAVPTPGAATTSTAPLAPTAGALAAQQKLKSIAACALGIGYSATWAAKLPRDLPLYPGALVTEAAGNDTSGCSLRVVSFQSAAAPDKVLAFYTAGARRAGYSATATTDRAERQLGGVRATDGGAYNLYVRPRPDGGSDADLVVNHG